MPRERLRLDFFEIISRIVNLAKNLNRMRKISIAVLAILVIFLGSRCFGGEKKIDSVVDDRIQVKTSNAAEEILTETIHLPGEISSAQTVELIAEVGGVLANIYMDEGSNVPTNQPLLRLEGDTQIDLANLSSLAANANVSNLYNILGSETRRLELQINELQSALATSQQNQHLTEEASISELRALEAQLNTAQTNLEVAQSNHEIAQAESQQSESNQTQQLAITLEAVTDRLDAMLEDINTFLAINDPQYNEFLREALESPNTHIYLVRADVHYRDANLALAAAKSNPTPSNLEFTIEEIGELVDELEAFFKHPLQFERPNHPFRDEVNLWISKIDGHQQALSTERSALENQQNSFNTSHIGSDARLIQAEGQLRLAQDNYMSMLANLESSIRRLEQQNVNAAANTRNLRNQINTARQGINAIQAQYGQQISQAQFNAQISETQLNQSQIQFQNGTLLSPIRGIFEGLDLNIGDFVSPGMSLGRIVDTSTLEVETFVSEFERGLIEQGDTAEINIEAYPEKTFQGEITFVASESNDPTRTFRVIAHVNPDGELIGSGMSAEIIIEVPLSEKPTIVIPLASVLSDSRGEYVYAVTQNEDEKIATRRNVTIGEVAEQNVQIINGLKKSEEVISQGQNLLNDGDRIQVL